MTQERNNLLKNLNQVKEELNKKTRIIMNGDAQLRQLDSINLAMADDIKHKDEIIAIL